MIGNNQMFVGDRFGACSLFYHKNKWYPDLAKSVQNQGFYDFSPEGITSYLTFRYPIGDLTMFKGCSRSPPAVQISPYGEISPMWHPKFGGTTISFENAMKITEKLLLESIKKISEGKKIGITLSGGLDSSLICAMVRHLYPDDEIYTYSVGFYGDDEFEYSRRVARTNDTIHKEIVLNKEDFIGSESLLRPLIKQKGSPLHPNEIALAEAEGVARSDNCDIVLCGEGADDIFGGYGQILRMYMNYSGDVDFFSYFLNNYRYFSLEDRSIINDRYLVDDVLLLNKYLPKSHCPKEIQNYVFYFIQMIHTTGLITRGTNALKFNKFPPGFPYLDDELVDFVNSLPFDYKVHWKSESDASLAKSLHYKEISERLDVPKYLLKKVAEKYLPYDVIYRPKYGFPVPFERWFEGVDSWPLDNIVFKSDDISDFNGWKKFMVINLNTFVEEFKPYMKG